MVALQLVMLILHLSLIQFADCTNYLVRQFDACVPRLPIKLNATFYDEIPQTLNITSDSPYDIGDNMLMKYKVYLHVKERRVLLFDGSDNRGPCKVIDNYLGSLLYDIQKEFSSTPEKCPFPKGKYNIYNYKPDFSKMKIKTLPPGKVTARGEWYLKTTRQLVYCAMLTIESI